MSTEDPDKVHVIARTMFRSPANGGTITIVDVQDDAGNLLGSARGVDSPTKIAGMALAQMEARLARAREEIAACGLLVNVPTDFSKAELAEYERLQAEHGLRAEPVSRSVSIHPDPADLIWSGIDPVMIRP